VVEREGICEVRFAEGEKKMTPAANFTFRCFLHLYSFDVGVMVVEREARCEVRFAEGEKSTITLKSMPNNSDLTTKSE
jgi:hypothetical protein